MTIWTKRIIATEARATLFALLDEVEKGEEVVITRRGRAIARLTLVRGPKWLKGRFAGKVEAHASEEELFSPLAGKWRYD